MSFTRSDVQPRIRVGDTIISILIVLLNFREPITAAVIREKSKLPSGNVSPAMVALAKAGVVHASDHPTETYQHRVTGVVTPRPQYVLTKPGARWAREAVDTFALKPRHRFSIWLPVPRPMTAVNH